MLSPVAAVHAAATARADDTGPTTPPGWMPSSVARSSAAVARSAAASGGIADTSRPCGGVQLAAPTTDPESVIHQKLGGAL